MPAQDKTRHQILEQLTTETETVVLSQFPEAKVLLQPSSALSRLKNPLKNFKDQDQKAKLISQITLEEYQATLQKLARLIETPVRDYQDEELLYLEQQLTDLLGFSISATQEDHLVPFVGGVMMACPHLKRTPTDELADHEEILEAGLSQKRSFFGWFHPSQLDTQAKLYEKYYFSLPLHLSPKWQLNPKKEALWFKHKKLIMINPTREVAVVGILADVGPYHLVRAQFGGSPEVIRLGEVWHPASKGKVAIFFVDDPENKVPLGQIKLKQKLSLKAKEINYV